MSAKKKKRRVTNDELGIVVPTDEVVTALAAMHEGITEEVIEEILAQEMRKADAIRRYLPSVLRMTRRRKRVTS